MNTTQTKPIDPLCEYLFRDGPSKTSFTEALNEDIRNTYSNSTRYNLSDYESGKAANGILNTALKNKSLAEEMNQQGQLSEFYDKTLSLMEENLQSSTFDAASAHIILTNLMAILNRDCREKEEELNPDSPYFDTVGIVNHLRELFKFPLQSIKQIKNKHTVIIVLCVILALFAALLCMGFCSLVWSSPNSASPQWCASIARAVLSVIAAEPTVELAKRWVFFTVVLLLVSIWLIVKEVKRLHTKLEIHYLCRLIGANSEKLRKEGWL